VQTDKVKHFHKNDQNYKFTVMWRISYHAYNIVNLIIKNKIAKPCSMLHTGR